MCPTGLVHSYSLISLLHQPKFWFLRLVLLLVLYIVWVVIISLFWALLCYSLLSLITFHKILFTVIFVCHHSFVFSLVILLFMLMWALSYMLNYIFINLLGFFRSLSHSLLYFDLFLLLFFIVQINKIINN